MPSLKKYFNYCLGITFENDVQNNYFFAECSSLAYHRGKFVKEQFDNIGFKNHTYLSIKSAQVHIASNTGHIIIAFRGTEPQELNDIKADISLFKRPAKSGQEGWVHRGFQKEVDKLWNSILEVLPNTTKKQIWITGHSLGAAMATICASRLEHLNPKLYTYGSPRVGGEIFCKGLKVEHKRFVNNNDVVPKFPLWIMGFAHHGELCYINHYGNMRNGESYWQRFKDKMRGRWVALKKWQFFDGFKDHSSTRYSNKLRNLWSAIV